MPMMRVMVNVTSVASLERDAELMLRVRDGDETSFALLLEKHRNSVIHFLYRMVQNQAIAEELAQEVFLRVYRSRETYEPTAKFTTWLFRITTHLALNHVRDRRNDKLNDSIDEKIEDGAPRQLPAREANVEERLLRVAGRQCRRERVDRGADVENLPQVGGREGGHAGASAGVELHHAAEFEFDECLPDRCAAHAEFRREGRFGEGRTGGQVARDDCAGDFHADVAGQRGTAQAIERHRFLLGRDRW